MARLRLARRVALGHNGAADGTLVRASRKGGAWAKRPLTTAEAAAWLHNFLDRFLGEAAVAALGAHSCRVTVLSCCAKAGVWGELRIILGGHSKPKDRSVTEYARDAFVAPMFAVEQL